MVLFLISLVIGGGVLFNWVSRNDRDPPSVISMNFDTSYNLRRNVCWAVKIARFRIILCGEKQF